MRVDTKAIEVKMAELGIKTYVDMAKRTGLDRITISNVINNKSNPSPETMDALYRVLELTPEEAGRIFFTEKLTYDVSKDKESVKER